MAVEVFGLYGYTASRLFGYERSSLRREGQETW
jgi:hypothetical protein